MKALFLLALCLAFTCCLSQKESCPLVEDIKPCSCTIGVDQKPWISCEGLSDLKDLLKALKGMDGFKVSTFYLTRSDIGALPSDAFSKTDIQFLNIMFTNLTSLSESINRPPFLGLEKSLEALEIRDGFIDSDTPLTRLSVSHLKKLTLLQLEGNVIPTIGNEWFESGPYGLRELYLLDTSTSQLGSHAFVSLIALRKLSLTGGYIKEINRDMFAEPALFIESLDFSNNKISVIPDNIFTKMPSLKEVFLESNDLKTINEVSFAPVWGQLSHVFFYGNPLNCDKDIKWIYKYRLPDSLGGNCASPPSMQFRSLSNITLADFQ